MFVGITTTTTTTPDLRRTIWGEGGKGRTEKYADFNNVDVKDNEEGIDLPLILTRRRRHRQSRQQRIWSGCPQPPMRL